MSLDFSLMVTMPTEVFSANITHNLNRMAEEAGIYDFLWHPDILGVTTASQMIKPLTDALVLMRSDPERFKKFNAPNGWGMYEHFIDFVEEVLTGCKENPDATIEVSR